MALLLLFLFLLLPIAEIYVIVQVGQAIGIWPTLAILLLDGSVGAALARSQGRMAWPGSTSPWPRAGCRPARRSTAR